MSRCVEILKGGRCFYWWDSNQCLLFFPCSGCAYFVRVRATWLDSNRVGFSWFGFEVGLCFKVWHIFFWSVCCSVVKLVYYRLHTVKHLKGFQLKDIGWPSRSQGLSINSWLILFREHLLPSEFGPIRYSIICYLIFFKWMMINVKEDVRLTFPFIPFHISPTTFYVEWRNCLQWITNFFL